MQSNKEHLRNFLTTELQGNLKILIDPKKKDSFSDSRISTWSHTVVERILHHLLEENNGKVG
ncbi:hypothetical protein OAA40_00750 [bacterium]|nr:hypothetical protein [bacterium]|tara:strand:- start:150 stop:335 length:186 start_codon:yes stop_codon:yes gene_type:complete